jgi:hypothetical protein
MKFSKISVCFLGCRLYRFSLPFGNSGGTVIELINMIYPVYGPILCLVIAILVKESIILGMNENHRRSFDKYLLSNFSLMTSSGFSLTLLVL